MSTPASRNGPTRAADTDRIQVAQLLTEAAAQGRLPMTEYEDRLTRAYAARPTTNWPGSAPIFPVPRPRRAAAARAGPHRRRCCWRS